MAVYPPSAARGFISRKDNIKYDDTSAKIVPSDSEIKIIVDTPNKEYTMLGNFTVPENHEELMICGGEKWSFDITEEKEK